MSKKDKYEKFSKEDLIKKILFFEKRKKYGLVWEEFDEDIVKLNINNFPAVKEIKNRRLFKNNTKLSNFIIEGDNYNSLKLLNLTHSKKFDVIYIDPPYNTGARDWKYNNDYVDNNDRWRHSKWINFMSNRLKLCKNLLSNSGVLICTIDHHEQENLGLLLREIFYSFEIVCVTIVHNPAGTQGLNFSNTNEYAYFVYPKNGKYIADEIREDTFDQRNLRDVTGEDSLRKAGKNCFFPIIIKNNKVLGFGDVCKENYHPKVNIKRKDGSIEIYPIDPEGVERKWRFARNTIENIKSELVVKYIKKRNIWDIQRKKNIFKYKTVWTDSKFFANNQGTQLLNKILPKNNFPYPKSLYAVMECIKAAENGKKDTLVLDFFAGSGTTGHAVLKLNSLDKGNRKFILCTNNENKIAEDVCYPRVEKVIKGYNEKLDKNASKGFDENLLYYQIKMMSLENTDPNKALIIENIEDLIAFKEQAFESVTKSKDLIILKNHSKNVAIIKNDNGLKQLKEKYLSNTKIFWEIYIFSLEDENYDDDFKEFISQININIIPLSIINYFNKFR